MSILTIFLGIFLTYPGIIPILYPGFYAKKSGLNVDELLQNFKGVNVIKDVLSGAYQASLVTIINYFALESGNVIASFVVSILVAMVLFKHIQYAK
jgi:uncharacterized membrane protein YjjB (DUF3815 family)